MCNVTSANTVIQMAISPALGQTVRVQEAWSATIPNWTAVCPTSKGLVWYQNGDVILTLLHQRVCVRMVLCADTCGCGGVSRSHIGFCGSEATQAAEPVTNDYTYHPRAQEAGEGGWEEVLVEEGRG